MFVMSVRFVQVDALQGHRVIDVACGSGDAQTLCLTDDDMVWSWGDGDYGKLGRGGSDGCKIPMKVKQFVQWREVSGRQPLFVLRTEETTRRFSFGVCIFLDITAFIYYRSVTRNLKGMKKNECHFCSFFLKSLSSPISESGFQMIKG